MKQNINNKNLLLKSLGFALVAMTGVGAEALAAANPSSTPNPRRRVYVRPVATQAFQLPNGVRVDLSHDLNAMLMTAASSMSNLDPIDTPEDDECGVHLELRAAVSTIELGILELGLTVGYTPAGGLGGGISNANGEMNVQIGTIAMNFGVWECVSGRCTQRAAIRASHNTSRIQLKFAINFGEITTGASLLYNTPLGAGFQTIMNDAMKGMHNLPRLNELTWKAQVMEVDQLSGVIYFDQGTQSYLKPGQTFTVFAGSRFSGSCAAYKAVAYVRTTQVDAVGSVAAVEKSFDNRGVQPGDVVMIRAK